MIPLTKGKEYSNNDLVSLLKISNSGGIRSSNSTHSIALITVNRKTSGNNPYADGYVDNGLYRYTGQGLLGDQTMTLNNKKVAEAEISGDTLYLFISDNVNKYRFEGYAKVKDIKYVFEPDANGSGRMVFKFYLEIR